MEGSKDATPQRVGPWYEYAAQHNHWSCSVYTTQDGGRLVVGPVSDRDEPYHGSTWSKLFATRGHGLLPETAVRTYVRLLALRSRVEAERARGGLGPLTPLSAVERELSQRETIESPEANDMTPAGPSGG